MSDVLKRSTAGIVLVIMSFVFSLFYVPLGVAHAEDIPDNNPVYDDYETPGNGNSGNFQAPDANEVFGGIRVGRDDTGLSSKLQEVLNVGVAFVISAANIIFMAFLLIYFAIECLMMAFPFIATVMASKVPVQLFSNECAKVCGVKYSYKPGGGGEGAQAASGGDANGKKDTFMAKFTTYFKERMITLIICGVILVLCATGLMPKLISLAINWIIGLFIH